MGIVALLSVQRGSLGASGDEVATQSEIWSPWRTRKAKNRGSTSQPGPAHVALRHADCIHGSQQARRDCASLLPGCFQRESCVQRIGPTCTAMHRFFIVGPSSWVSGASAEPSDALFMARLLGGCCVVVVCEINDLRVPRVVG